MKTVIISPFSRRTRKGNKSPKDYPFWADVVKQLKEWGLLTVQVGQRDEELLGTADVRLDQPLAELKELIVKADAWISVDNFFHHLCAGLGKPGVVIFGTSDPAIFGHSVNVNLLKDAKYLRPNQFLWWEDDEPNPEAFVEPKIVCDSVLSLLLKELKTF